MNNLYNNADFKYLNADLTSIGRRKLKTFEKKQPIRINNIYFHGAANGDHDSELFSKNNNTIVIRWKKLFKDGAGEETADLLCDSYENKLFKKYFIEGNEPLTFTGISMGIGSLKHCLKRFFSKIKEEIKELNDDDFDLIFAKQKLSLEQIKNLKKNQDLMESQALELFKSRIKIDLISIPDYFLGFTVNIDEFTKFLKDNGMDQYLKNISIKLSDHNSKLDIFLHPFKRSKKFLEKIAENINLKNQNIYLNYDDYKEKFNYQLKYIYENILFQYFNDEEFYLIVGSKKPLLPNINNLDAILKIDDQKERYLSKIYSFLKIGEEEIYNVSISPYLNKKIKLIKLYLEKGLINCIDTFGLFLQNSINPNNIDEYFKSAKEINNFFESDLYQKYIEENLNTINKITLFNFTKYKLEQFLLNDKNHNFLKNIINSFISMSTNNNNEESFKSIVKLIIDNEKNTLMSLEEKFLLIFDNEAFDEKIKFSTNQENLAFFSYLSRNKKIKEKFSELELNNFLNVMPQIRSINEINDLFEFIDSSLENNNFSYSTLINSAKYQNIFCYYSLKDSSITSSLNNNFSSDDSSNIFQSDNKYDNISVLDNENIIINNNKIYKEILKTIPNTNIRKNIKYKGINKDISDSIKSLENSSKIDISNYTEKNLCNYKKKLDKTFDDLKSYLVKFKKEKLGNGLSRCTLNNSKYNKYRDKIIEYKNKINKKIMLNKNRYTNKSTKITQRII